MSTANSTNHKAVGTTKIRPLTPMKKGDDYYRCRWDLKGPLRFCMKERIKSPIFALPNRDDCKWYLSVHHLGYAAEDQIFFASCLHLDPTSKCKEVVVRFGIDVEDRSSTIARTCKSKTFKFVNESQNSDSILSIMCFDDLEVDYENQDEGVYFLLRVRCTMMIEKCIPKGPPPDFGSLLKNNLLTDVVLSVGEKKFPAHKVILTSCSSVFRAMFIHNTTENQGVVDIKDVREEVVEEMLNFIYTGESEKLNELAQDLLIAADKYDLKGLQSECEGVLIESLSNSNVIDLLLFAEFYNASHLKFEAINLIRREKTELMKTEGWKSLDKSNPALVREISETRLHPEPASDSDSDSDGSYYSMTDSDSEWL